MSRSQRVRVGISTCPNDTFAFHALINREVDCHGVEYEFELLDIQQLNQRLLAGDFDVAKTSFHAALLLADQCWVLQCGSALGFGVGPLMLAARADEVPTGLHQLTLCPGQHTTATLLLRLFYGDTTRVEQVLFSDIMPRLQLGTADFGVCIHEGRFTWQQQGLSLVEDLGTRWEQTTGSPLPLGGLVARRGLSPDLLQVVQATITESIAWGLDHPEATLPTMRRYAREFDDEVLMQHVHLYVNDWTLELGEVGEQALEALSRQAQQVGLIDRSIRLQTLPVDRLRG